MYKHYMLQHIYINNCKEIYNAHKNNVIRVAVKIFQVYLYLN